MADALSAVLRYIDRLSSMNGTELRLALIPSADEPLLTGEYQQALREFEEFLQSCGLDVSAMIDVAEDATSGSAVYLGQFTIEVLKSPVIQTVAAGMGAWVVAKYGRKVRLKIGDIEAEGRTTAEIEKLLKTAEDFQRRNRSKAIHEP